MPTLIAAERPDTVDATLLIRELDAYLEPLYPQESRHGFRIEQLLREAVAFFVMRHDGMAAGCGGVRLFGTAYGEIKRMYVRPEFRRMQFERRLTETLIRAAKEAGYGVMRLETVTFMDKAIAMYSSFGFERCPPYYVIPESFRAITVFMQLNLADAG